MRALRTCKNVRPDEEEGPGKWGSNKKFIYVKALCTKVKGILPDFGKA